MTVGGTGRREKPRAGRRLIRRVIISAAVAAGVTAFFAAGIAYGADNAVSDALYRERRAVSGEVVVLGIDSAALDALGPLPWDRGVMADIIESLNADEDARPAVIGVDMLYIGESMSPESDARLARAAAEHGNVVVASSAVFGLDITETDGGHYSDPMAVVLYEQPYEALREAAAVGHINAMLDDDGLLRHGMLGLDTPDGRHIEPFASVIYEKYARSHGMEPKAEPPSVGRPGQYYIPYAGEPGDFYAYSVAAALTPGASLDLGGKAVIIGPYAAGMQDDYFTPMAYGEKMFGAECQANMVEARIAGDVKRTLNFGAGNAAQAAALFIISFAALMLFWDRKALPATVLWLALAGGSVLASKLLYMAGFVTHALWTPAAVTALYIVSVAANYVRAALEKRRVTSTFGRYVSPEVAAEILREGAGSLGLGGEIMHIAVMFVDIRGFTSIAERLGPKQVVELLNGFLEHISACIMRNGGTLDKFVGDAVMALWGAPIVREDYIYGAARAAVEIMDGAHGLFEAARQKYGCEASLGIGLHCGDAVVGNIGSRERMDYTAIGDTVNTAARLESIAGPGSILISRAVADALTGRIETGEPHVVALKGKAGGFEVLDLLGLSGGVNCG